MNEASPSETAGQDLLARKAMAASMKLFSVPARQYAEQRVNSGPELVDYMRRKQSPRRRRATTSPPRAVCRVCVWAASSR